LAFQFFYFNDLKEKVGKTSIIMSLVGISFREKVPQVISVIVLSPEIIGEPVTTRILIDTSRIFLLFFQNYFFDLFKLYSK
jgi:GTPase SAR1 family protein